jgi:hypothetical protein
VERAIEPGVETRRDLDPDVGDADEYSDAGNDQGRDEDGEGNPGDGERHDNQGRRDRAAPAVAPLFLEEVDQRHHWAGSLLARASS